MTIARRAVYIVSALREAYPEASCTLNYRKDYELLFSVRLSAQCTDARVNVVAETLFQDYPTLESFAAADLAALEETVRPCGFYRMKARDIVLAARMLIDEFGGSVPDSMEALLRLPGVGRKTANLIRGDLFGQGGIVADTHCIRIANRLGLCKTTDPHKVELALGALIPVGSQTAFCHALVFHGRQVCKARRPECQACCLSLWCGADKKVVRVY